MKKDNKPKKAEKKALPEEEYIEKKKMAFLLATNSWEKMEVHEEFIAKRHRFVWRMGGTYTSEYLAKIQYPIIVYFFHRNSIKFRAKCENIVVGRSWSLQDIPSQFRLDNTPYSMFLLFTELERIRETHIWDFPKWESPKEYFKRGNLRLLKVVDIFEKSYFIPIEKDANVGYTEDDEGFAEGKKALKNHLVRERNPKVASKAKQKMLKDIGKLECQACNFIFEDKYGKLGKNYIETHHLKPVSELKEDEKTKVSDIALVCSNCHRMLHKKRPWLTMKDLKIILEER